MRPNFSTVCGYGRRKMTSLHSSGKWLNAENRNAPNGAENASPYRNPVRCRSWVKSYRPKRSIFPPFRRIFAPLGRIFKMRCPAIGAWGSHHFHTIGLNKTNAPEHRVFMDLLITQIYPFIYVRFIMDSRP